MCKIPPIMPMSAQPFPPDATASAPARISARSRGQAMDWSLVLVSQGIEHTIEGPPDAGPSPLLSLPDPTGRAAAPGWGLLLAGADHRAALAAIQLYRRDNRRWQWRRALTTNGPIFDGVSLAWVALTVFFYWLSATRNGFREAGMLDGAMVAAGEWWRLFTATLLHADGLHLASNALFGFLLLGLAAGCYGTGLGLLAAFLAGVAGNLASWGLHGNALHGLGASGVVMGALGLLAVHSLAHWRKLPGIPRLLIGGLAVGLMLFAMLGLSPGTDTVAHFGGFLAGILIGALLSLWLPPPVSSRVNFLAGFGFGALVLLTWALALRRIG